MKTRNGFVSNSSSTSFTLLTTEEEHAKILARLDAVFAEAADKLVARKRIGGVDFVLMGVEYGDVEEIFSANWQGLDQKPEFDFSEVSLSELVYQYREAAKASGADAVFGSHSR